MVLDVFRTVEPVPYRGALERQRELHRRRAAGEINDTLWLLEHPPVLTTGIRRDQGRNVLVNLEDVGAEIVETERGGEVTYHGPGQLVGYLFVGMENHGYRVKDFVRKIEGAFIDCLEAEYGIGAHHDDEHTGVWVGSEKITAIGIGLRERVTLHGFAFNVNTNLDHFKWIVPCGIDDAARGVTSLKKLCGREMDLGCAAEKVTAALRRVLGYDSGRYEQDYTDPCSNPWKPSSWTRCSVAARPIRG